MKWLPIGVLAAAMAVSWSAVAQNGDLPSAPSAARQPQPVPAPQPAPSPAQKAAPPTAPAPAAPAPEMKASIPAQQPAAASPRHSGNGSSDDPAAPTDDEAITTIVHRVDEVNVIFTVTDKHGKFIRNLTQDDFAVRDDNKPPRAIVNFRRETDLPLRVGLLIDASNSIRDRFRFEQEAASEFLHQIIRAKSDRAFVLGFDTTAEVTQDFTDNNEQLSKGIRMLRPGGGTALYDAIYYACRDKLMKAPQSGPVRRAIILLSDGDDNQSRVTREEAIDMAQRAEVIIYAISTNVSGMKLRGDKYMERIAEATGGRAFFPFKIQDVADAFSEIQDELRSQYAVAYKPADFVADGRYHSIEIVAQNHKNLRVRARKGYYAPKQ